MSGVTDGAHAPPHGNTESALPPQNDEKEDSKRKTSYTAAEVMSGRGDEKEAATGTRLDLDALIAAYASKDDYSSRKSRNRRRGRTPEEKHKKEEADEQEQEHEEEDDGEEDKSDDESDGEIDYEKEISKWRERSSRPVRRFIASCVKGRGRTRCDVTNAPNSSEPTATTSRSTSPASPPPSFLLCPASLWLL